MPSTGPLPPKKPCHGRPRRYARSLTSLFKRGLRRIHTCLHHLIAIPPLWAEWLIPNLTHVKVEIHYALMMEAGIDRGHGTAGQSHMARREGYASLDPSVRSKFLPQKLCQYFPERMILRWNYSSAIALNHSPNFLRARSPGSRASPRSRREGDQNLPGRDL